MKQSSRSVGRRAYRVFPATAVVLAFLAFGFAALRPPALPLTSAPDAVGSKARGASLAALGNCGACHTAPGGAAYAGGVAIKTAFGTIYSTDITPARSGIGGWSLAAFARALRDGVSRDGHYLYPAFPYDHFRALETQDIEDLYAFLMSRTPVEASPPPNRMMFPFGFRPLLAAWDWLFLPARAADIGTQDRGRYLVEALAHCGACHRPRGLFGQEKRGAFVGGVADGWYAPPLDADNPAPRAWTADDLHAYLSTGLSDRHAAAAGPMGEVARSLNSAPDEDVSAIAAYVAGLMPPHEDRTPTPREGSPAGAALFAGACAACHGEGAAMRTQGRPPLGSGTPLYEDSPRDTLAILLRGLKPPVGRSGPYMPLYADTLSDADLGELATYLRARFTDRPAWSGDMEAQVRDARRETAP